MTLVLLDPPSLAKNTVVKVLTKFYYWNNVLEAVVSDLWTFCITASAEGCLSACIVFLLHNFEMQVNFKFAIIFLSTHLNPLKWTRESIIYLEKKIVKLPIEYTACVHPSFILYKIVVLGHI